MQLTQVFPLGGVPIAVPPSTGLVAVLPNALAGALSVSPLPGRAAGTVFTLPSGTRGVVPLPVGSTGIPAWATLSNPADAAGAFIVVCPGTADVTEFPSDEPWHVDLSTQWPWACKGLGLTLGVARALWLNLQFGSLGAMAGAGSVAIRGTLAGTLTIAGNGAPQVIAAGTSGIVALSQPIASTSTFAFTSYDDWTGINGTFVLGTRA